MLLSIDTADATVQIKFLLLASKKRDSPKKALKPACVCVTFCTHNYKPTTNWGLQYLTCNTKKILLKARVSKIPSVSIVMSVSLKLWCVWSECHSEAIVKRGFPHKILSTIRHNWWSDNSSKLYIVQIWLRVIRICKHNRTGMYIIIVSVKWGGVSITNNMWDVW